MGVSITKRRWGIACEACGGKTGEVVDSRPRVFEGLGTVVRRTRRCPCGHITATLELPEAYFATLGAEAIEGLRQDMARAFSAFDLATGKAKAKVPDLAMTPLRRQPAAPIQD